MSPSKAAAKQGERRSEKELKSAGLKATGPRMRILELFEDALVNGPNRHLTAEDVYKQLVAEEFDVGLATVYRVLSQFESAGLIVRRYFGNDRASARAAAALKSSWTKKLNAGSVKLPTGLGLSSKTMPCRSTAFAKSAGRRKRPTVPDGRFSEESLLASKAE